MVNPTPRPTGPRGIGFGSIPREDSRHRTRLGTCPWIGRSPRGKTSRNPPNAAGNREPPLRPRRPRRRPNQGAVTTARRARRRHRLRRLRGVGAEEAQERRPPRPPRGAEEEAQERRERPRRLPREREPQRRLPRPQEPQGRPRRLPRPRLRLRPTSPQATQGVRRVRPRLDPITQHRLQPHRRRRRPLHPRRRRLQHRPRRRRLQPPAQLQPRLQRGVEVVRERQNRDAPVIPAKILAGVSSGVSNPTIIKSSSLPDGSLD